MNYLNAVALIPYYDSNGYNCTRLIFADGSEVSEYIPINKIVEEMHIHYHTSYHANVRWASYYLLGKGNLPLALDEQHILLRCQMRSGVGKREGCYGYISLFAIKHIESATIYLDNNVEIPTCSNIHQLTKSFKRAALLYAIYLVTKGPSPLLPLHTKDLLHKLTLNLNKKSKVKLSSTHPKP